MAKKKQSKEELLQQVDEFCEGMNGTKLTDVRVYLKLIMKSIELHNEGLKCSDIGVRK